MQFNVGESIKKIYTAFRGLQKLPKIVIRQGIHAFLFLLAIGTLIIVLNRTTVSFNYFSDFVALSLVKTSFIILAEGVIGGLVMDFVFKKN